MMKDYKNVLGRVRSVRFIITFQSKLWLIVTFYDFQIIIPTLVALLLTLIIQNLNFDPYVQMEMSLDKYINPSVMMTNSSNQRINQLLINYVNSKHVTYVTFENSSLIESGYL